MTRYTDREKAIVAEGIEHDKSAQEIAAQIAEEAEQRDDVFPRTDISVYNYVRAHYDKRIKTVPRKPKAQTVKPPPEQGYQIPDAGHMGVTAHDDEKPIWQGWLNDIFEGTGLYLLRDQWAYALQAGAEKARGDG